jgi:hypothetical protein
MHEPIKLDIILYTDEEIPKEFNKGISPFGIRGHIHNTQFSS